MKEWATPLMAPDKFDFPYDFTIKGRCEECVMENVEASQRLYLLFLGNGCGSSSRERRDRDSDGGEYNKLFVSFFSLGPQSVRGSQELMMQFGF